MKVVSISDTHGTEFGHRIPKCDVFIHAGDICHDLSVKDLVLDSSKTYEDYRRDMSAPFQKEYFYKNFLEELKKIDTQYIIIVPGNHDNFLYYLTSFDKHGLLRHLMRSLQKPVVILDDSICQYRGVVFYGNSWVTGPNKLFSYTIANDHELASKFQNLTGDYKDIPIDVMITHNCPIGYGDNAKKYPNHLGSQFIRDISRTFKPKFHLSGHFHDAEHYHHETHSTVYHNCSQVDLAFNVCKEPYEFEIQEAATTDIFNIPQALQYMIDTCECDRTSCDETLSNAYPNYEGYVRCLKCCLKYRQKHGHFPYYMIYDFKNPYQLRFQGQPRHA